jgi:uncharacterized membrane protein YidH (DUF202 family)
MVKKRSLKKDIFPFSIALGSLVYSFNFYISNIPFIERKFYIAFIIWQFSRRGDIFFFSGFIAFCSLTFFFLDRFYFKKAVTNRFYYFWEFYLASNFILLTMLSYQYGATKYLTQETADLYVYFSPLGSISFFTAVILILRVILRSGSRLLYDEEAETNE